ncbi:MAG: HAD hydrolase-like protein [Acetobacteraceae bacterium]|nr:HAD hydrolase-like protein [Acetobacteraceae bacterium]
MTEQAVLLDLDGTLADSRPGIEACFRHMLTELGHDPTTAGDLTWAVGPPIAVSIGRMLALYGDDRVDLGLTSYRARYTTVGIYECTIFAGVVGMLDALRDAGCVMCIATSKRRDFAERVIDYLELRPYVRAVYGALPAGGLDAKADLLAHILSHESFDPADTVMIGDRLHDVHAAQANRLRSIGALWGYGGREELEAAGADAIAGSPLDVPGLV